MEILQKVCALVVLRSSSQIAILNQYNINVRWAIVRNISFRIFETYFSFCCSILSGSFMNNYISAKDVNSLTNGIAKQGWHISNFEEDDVSAGGRWHPTLSSIRLFSARMDCANSDVSMAASFKKFEPIGCCVNPEICVLARLIGRVGGEEVRTRPPLLRSWTPLNSCHKHLFCGEQQKKKKKRMPHLNGGWKGQLLSQEWRECWV